MIHDPLCPHDYTPYHLLGQNSCQCDIIAKVREDEVRNDVLAAAYYGEDGYRTGYAAALRDQEETWICGDCNNTYGPDVERCPNRILDSLALAKNNEERLSEKWHSILREAFDAGTRCRVECENGLIVIGHVDLPHCTDFLFTVGKSITVNTKYPLNGSIVDVSQYSED